MSRAFIDWRKEDYAKMYAERELTLQRAAMEGGISVREMMDYLKDRRTPVQYDLEDLEEDMRNFYGRMGH